MSNHYTVVKLSGSTCMCRARRHVADECGHKHRTEDAAYNCLVKLQNWDKEGRNCSAHWYNGRVVERDSEGREIIRDSVFDDEGIYTQDKVTTDLEMCTC